MKILITGATGFLGGQLAERLTSQHHDIRALVRKTSQVDGLKRIGVELVYGDIGDPASLQQAVQDVDVVIHCASLVGEAGSRDDYIRVNVEGTRNILEACRSVELKRFIHISSLSVITGYMDHYGTREDEPYHPTGENYADTKIEAEKLVMDYHRGHNIPVVVLRPGFIYGPGDKVFLPTVINNLREGKIKLIDHGKKLLNLTYVENLMEAIELALEKDAAVGEVFNITDGEEVSKKRFFFKVADLMSLSRPTKSVPFIVARITCAIVTALYKILPLKGTPPITRMKLRFVGQNQWFDVSKAESRLGYQHSVHFDDAMQKAVDWYRKWKPAQPS